MNSRHGPVSTLAKIGFLTLIGLATVFLAGPILTILALVLSVGLMIFCMVLPFALVGLLVWVPLRALFQGTSVAWKDTCDIGKGMWTCFVVPVRGCGRVVARTVDIGQRIRKRSHALASWLRGIFVETVSAALVGGLLGAFIGGSNRGLGVSILFGALTGAVLGALVGVSGMREATELPDQAPQSLS